MANQQLDDLIASLKLEGRFDSSGRFSLDARKAAHKLAHFQLASQELYLLKLVQAAIASDCKYVQVFLGRNRVTVLAPLRKPAPFNLTQVLDEAALAMPSPRSSALRHLAVGMRAALEVNPHELRLFLFDSGEALVHGEQPLVLAIPEGQRDSLGLGLDFGFAVQLAWKSRFWGRSYNPAPEHQALYKRCAYAPVEVLVDQRPVNQASEWMGWGGYRLVARPPRQGFPGVAVAHPMGSEQEGVPLPIEPRPRVRRHRAFMLLPKHPFHVGLTLTPLWDGVALDPVEVRSHHAGAAAVACLGSYGLSADLSEFQVVRNEAFLAMLEDLG